MERAALLERLTPGRAAIVWRVATVRELRPEAARAKTIVLDVPGWPGHLAGQHVDVRLTAEDGYQAQRSYSIASAPEDDAVALTAERIDDGEVSPYLSDELRAGDRFELRGPIGGHFTWRVADGGPLLLIGGGSGLVPLMAMLRHRSAAHPQPAGGLAWVDTAGRRGNARGSRARTAGPTPRVRLRPHAVRRARSGPARRARPPSR